MTFGQLLRVLLGISILGIMIYIYLPHLFFTYSSSAVVSGNLISLNTPIKGAVKVAPPPVGSEVKRGDRLVVIEDETVDRAVLEHYEAEQTRLQERLAGLKTQAEELIHLKEELTNSGEGYRQALLRQLRIDIDQAKSRHEELKATQQLAAIEFLRKDKLYQKGGGVAISKADFDTAYYANERAVRAAEQARLEVIRLMSEYDAMQNNIHILSDRRKEVPYQVQRIDEVTLRHGEVERDIRQTEGELVVMKKDFVKEQERFEKQKSDQINAPVHGVIWSKPIAVDTQVDARSMVVQLVDCERPVVRMALPERYFERIKVGDPVDIRLPGHNGMVPGRVSSVRGGSVVQDSTTFAAFTRVRPHLEIEVFIEIDEKDLEPKSKSGDFCNVGRNAEVIFKTNLGWFF